MPSHVPLFSKSNSENDIKIG